jgi:tetratricopeptide (TPR) repeat protein
VGAVVKQFDHTLNGEFRAEAVTILGKVAAKRGDYSEARRQFEKALVTHPGYEDAKLQLRHLELRQPALGAQRNNPPVGSQMPTRQELEQILTQLNRKKRLWVASVFIIIAVSLCTELYGRQQSGQSVNQVASAASTSSGNLNVPTRSFNVEDMKATSLRFYESGNEALPEAQRRYASRFARGRSRFINWELKLEYPSPMHRFDFSITQVWHHSDGSVLSQNTDKRYLEAGGNYSEHLGRYGEEIPSNWQVGTYGLDLFIEGKKVAAGYFEIYEDMPKLNERGFDPNRTRHVPNYEIEKNDRKSSKKPSGANINRPQIEQ